MSGWNKRWIEAQCLHPLNQSSTFPFNPRFSLWILNFLLPTLALQHMTGEFSREEKEAHFTILKIHNELKGQVKINLLFTKVSGPCLFYSPE